MPNPAAGRRARRRCTSSGSSPPNVRVRSATPRPSPAGGGGSGAGPTSRKRGAPAGARVGRHESFSSNTEMQVVAVVEVHVEAVLAAALLITCDRVAPSVRSSLHDGVAGTRGAVDEVRGVLVGRPAVLVLEAGARRRSARRRQATAPWPPRTPRARGPGEHGADQEHDAGAARRSCSAR